MITEERLDNIILKEIVHDMTVGSLLTEADDKTLKMMLTQMIRVKDYFRQAGVVIGEA